MKKGFTLAEVLMAKRTSGIENEVLHSRESEPKEPSGKIKRFLGFTLAEVLITLAVIGVVAALTIPVLVQKYQKKQLYTQFMKTYNTLTTAMDNAVAEYGDIEDWKWGKWVYDNETEDDEFVSGDDPIGKNIFSLMKVVKTCDKASDCFASGYTKLDGGDGSNPDYPENGNLTDVISYYGDGYDNKVAVLADGAVISAWGDDGSVNFIIDTNGKKGPNVLGRDLFFIIYKGEDEQYNRAAGFNLKDYDPEGDKGAPCSKDSDDDDNGYGCPSRLLQEGKMNY